MLKIAITGNIAAGKSSALKIFKENKGFTLNADKIGHKLLNEEVIKTRVINLFSDQILTQGKINRKKLAKIVFSDEKKLDKLEKLLHPKIFNEIKKEYKKNFNKKNFNFFVVEVPLLFECKKQDFFDIIITIIAKDIVAKKRANLQDYILRKKRQLSQKELEELSDYVVLNNQDKNSFKEKILKIIKNILRSHVK
ncbi:MAG: dephospho-CoA kinase [Chlamydiae bacterium RIFCSPHIGHO2_12_FULL_27_8]|nr:MAG: dephospho-CoA kinase [Chlamydiae bacterium RIFCSPHIGHO2_12_FULL_27_8]OGN65128.1 MAG: dephospho-CoA kinase [Chlamydiae bacterium RIFCSPLOWO2_01_FULL_28_7]